MTVPEVALVLGIRAALGVGLGLLVADSFSSAEKRTAVGWTLLAAGGFAAVCLGSEIFGHPRSFTLAFGTGDGVAPTQTQARQRVNQAGAMPMS
jgi:hypothetical protein